MGVLTRAPLEREGHSGTFSRGLPGTQCANPHVIAVPSGVPDFAEKAAGASRNMESIEQALDASTGRVVVTAGVPKPLQLRCGPAASGHAN